MAWRMRAAIGVTALLAGSILVGSAPLAAAEGPEPVRPARVRQLEAVVGGGVTGEAAMTVLSWVDAATDRPDVVSPTSGLDKLDPREAALT